jgi:hypothetical protein
LRFDKDAIAVNPSGEGNRPSLRSKAAGLYRINGPVQTVHDGNLTLTDKLEFTLRAEAFNVLNRVRMRNPDSTVTSVNFGVIRSQGNDPRRIQCGAKIVFWHPAKNRRKAPTGARAAFPAQKIVTGIVLPTALPW